MTEQEQRLLALLNELSERLTDQHEAMMELRERLTRLEGEVKGLDRRTAGMIVMR